MFTFHSLRPGFNRGLKWQDLSHHQKTLPTPEKDYQVFVCCTQYFENKHTLSDKV